jgi:DEAD/DEAH box helicase domain-containing protein
LAGRPWPYDELLNRLEKGSVELRGAAKSYREDLLSSLVALVSEARREVIDAAGHPRVVAFVDVRLQLWLRELRRMVVQVSREPRLRFADDLTQNQVESHLPVVHCRECNSMGWGATRRRGQAKVHSDLRQFYSSFFSRSQDLVFLFPERTAALADGIDGAPAKFCLSCLHLNGDTSVERCNECDAEDLLEVFVPDTRKRRGDSFHSTPD